MNSVAAVSCSVGDVAATAALVDRAIEAVARLIMRVVGGTESAASAPEPVGPRIESMVRGIARVKCRSGRIIGWVGPVAGAVCSVA